MREKCLRFLLPSLAAALVFSLFVLPPAFAVSDPDIPVTGEMQEEPSSTEPAEPEEPACKTPGGHAPGAWTYNGAGAHVSACTQCGAQLKENCAYPDPAVYTAAGGGKHFKACTVCGGKAESACTYKDGGATLPTQTAPGTLTRVCTLCGDKVTVETAAAESGRKESRLMGDVNNSGAADSNDARAILRAAVRLEPLQTNDLPFADLNEDGLVSAADARLALRTAVNLELPRRHQAAAKMVTKPTCTGTGVLTWNCAYCKTEHKLTVPANGHTWVEATEKAAKHCSVCGAKITGIYTLNGKTYYYTADGKPLSGKTLLNVTAQGKKALWYFNNGVLDTGFTGVAAYGGKYLYVKNGCANTNWRGILTQDGSDWIVENGEARKVATPSDRTLYRAFKEVAKATTEDMTKAQKLRACFVYCKKTYRECRPRTPHYCEVDWPMLYANDMFVGKGGNCLSYAAAFAYMAKAIGYEDVYCCNSGGHGWAEIGGNVFDPEWSKRDGLSAVTYYNLSYYAKCDVAYRAAISRKLDWMHVKVQPNMKITNLYNRCKAENNRYF